MKVQRQGIVTIAGLELLLGLFACVCVAGFVWMRIGEPKELTFVDRPRDEASHPDFVVRYLDATKVPYRLDHGFVRLSVHGKTANELRGLLSSLGSYIDLLQEDRQSIVAQRPTMENGDETVQRRSAEPTEDGRLAITSHTVSWTDDAWQELDQLILSLESQYRQVAEGLRQVDPSVVVPARFTPTEPRLAFRSADRQTLPRVGRTRSTAQRSTSHSSPRETRGEQIEMIDDSFDEEARTIQGRLSN